MPPRPISLTVFGILNIGYGALGLLGLVFMRVMLSMGDKVAANSPLKAFYSNPTQMHFLSISSMIGGMASAFLIPAGIGLLLGRNWARLTSVVWAAFDIVFVIVSLPFSWKSTYSAMAANPSGLGGMFAMIVTVLSLVFSLAYPVALLIFMTRPKVVAACNETAARIV